MSAGPGARAHGRRSAAIRSAAESGAALGLREAESATLKNHGVRGSLRPLRAGAGAGGGGGGSRTEEKRSGRHQASRRNKRAAAPGEPRRQASHDAERAATVASTRARAPRARTQHNTHMPPQWRAAAAPQGAPHGREHGAVVGTCLRPSDTASRPWGAAAPTPARLHPASAFNAATSVPRASPQHPHSIPPCRTPPDAPTGAGAGIPRGRPAATPRRSPHISGA